MGADWHFEYHGYHIYLAGSCSKEHRQLMEDIADFLRGRHQTVDCPFEFKVENAWDYSQEDWAELVFEHDKKCIDECDRMILISQGRDSTAGTNWEQGYAYAIGKPVYVIQVTDADTSLMTFCGCTRFFSRPLHGKPGRDNDEYVALYDILKNITLGDYDPNGEMMRINIEAGNIIPRKCRTRLT